MLRCSPAFLDWKSVVFVSHCLVRVVTEMAAKASQLRPGRVGRLLLRAVLDRPVEAQREPIMPASTAKLPAWCRLDQPETRDRDILRA
jgi:hypothetical protein